MECPTRRLISQKWPLQTRSLSKSVKKFTRATAVENMCLGGSVCGPGTAPAKARAPQPANTIWLTKCEGAIRAFDARKFLKDFRGVLGHCAARSRVESKASAASRLPAGRKARGITGIPITGRPSF